MPLPLLALLLTASAAEASGNDCPITFEAHPAIERAPAKRVLPDVRSGYARRYRTMIRTQTADGAPDFAGAFDIASWQDGTGQQKGVYIDQRTGVVRRLPDANAGYVYRPDSRLLIVNKPEHARGQYVDGRPLRSQYYLIGRTGLTKICEG